MCWLKQQIFDDKQMQNSSIHYSEGIFYPKLDILFNDRLSSAVCDCGYHSQNIALCLSLVFQIVADIDDMQIIFAKCEICCCCNDDWSSKAASKASACLIMSSNVLRWLALARISVWTDSLLIPLISWSLRWMCWRLQLHCGHLNSQSEADDLRQMTKSSMGLLSDWVMELNLRWGTAGFDSCVTIFSRMVSSQSSDSVIKFEVESTRLVCT